MFLKALGLGPKVVRPRQQRVPRYGEDVVLGLRFCGPVFPVHELVTMPRSAQIAPPRPAADPARRHSVGSPALRQSPFTWGRYRVAAGVAGCSRRGTTNGRHRGLSSDAADRRKRSAYGTPRLASPAPGHRWSTGPSASARQEPCPPCHGVVNLRARGGPSRWESRRRAGSAFGWVTARLRPQGEMRFLATSST
jgi:hypothetical protein